MSPWCRALICGLRYESGAARQTVTAFCSRLNRPIAIAMFAAVAPEKARISDFEFDRIDKFRGKNIELKTIRATINRASAVSGVFVVMSSLSKCLFFN